MVGSGTRAEADEGIELVKLLYTNGPDQGKEVELRPPFISAGRETDNDIVLLESQTSRYHAKIEMEGNTWFVRDLDSRNGVRLNGKRITKSSLLTINDELQIGDTVFRLLESAPAPASGLGATAAAALPPPEPPTEPPAAKAEGKAITEAKAAQVKRIRLLVVALITVVVVVGVILALPPDRAKRPPVAIDPFAEIKNEPLRVLYEMESSGRDDPERPYNVFMYQVSIEDKTLRVRLRDLADGLNQDQAAELDADTVTELKKALLTDDFLLADSLRRQKKDRVERHYLLAVAGRRGNCVEYVNETERQPAAVRLAIDTLNKLVDEKTKVNRVPRSLAFAEAERFFMNGVRLLAESSVHPENNYNAITTLRIAIKYLEGYDNPPEFYERAQGKLKEAEEKFNETIQGLRESARFQEKVDLAKAKAVYQEILDRIPDQNSPDYKEAKIKIVTINSKLRKPK